MFYINLDESCNEEFKKQVKELSGEDFSLCYQCGQCTASCPVTATGEGELVPHYLMNLLRLGQKDLLLSGKAVWQCFSCQACTSRCPQKIDVAHIIDILRILARTYSSDKLSYVRAKLFNETFTKLVAYHGRINEFSLFWQYNMLSGYPFFYFDLMLSLLAKGKAGCPKKTSNFKEITNFYQDLEKRKKQDES